MVIPPCSNTTYHTFSWIATPNGHSYQTVINLPKRRSLCQRRITFRPGRKPFFLFYSGASFEENNALTQILTQIAEKRRGAESNNLRVLGHLGPKNARKALNPSGWRNRQQLITRRSEVQVLLPQPEIRWNRLIPADYFCFLQPF